jgi:hypothetical protein
MPSKTPSDGTIGAREQVDVIPGGFAYELHSAPVGRLPWHVVVPASGQRSAVDEVELQIGVPPADRAPDEIDRQLLRAREGHVEAVEPPAPVDPGRHRRPVVGAQAELGMIAEQP